MNCELFITAQAEQDLNGAVNYIDHILLNPKAADDLLNEAERKLSELALFPEKYALADDPVLKSWGIRFTNVKNYLVFYLVSRQEQRVYIVRFLFQKRDWAAILKQGFSLE